MAPHAPMREKPGKCLLTWITQTVSAFRRQIVVVMMPLACLPIVVYGDWTTVSGGRCQSAEARRLVQMSKCAYVVAVMALYWVAEALPLAITAFLPFVLFPLLGVLPAKLVAPNYLKDSNFVFIGSLIMAVAVEESQLHRRVGLGFLSVIGSKPRWLLVGFQTATCFLSMWLSNAATTAMMLPIALAVIGALERLRHIGDGDARPDALAMSNERLLSSPNARFYKGILLSVCYAANIGGIGTLTGTSATIIFSGQLQSTYPRGTEVTYATWMVYAFPLLTACFVCSCIWMQFLFGGSCDRKLGSKNVHQIIQAQRESLGPLTCHELSTALLFGLLVVLWMTREPVVVAGWASLFADGFVTDGSVAMLVSCLLFVVPRKWTGKEEKPILTWHAMQHKFPWAMVMLAGGAYAMAAGVKSSGLSAWFGARLSVLAQLPPCAFVLCSVALVVLITELTSKFATASIFIPLVASIAEAAHINPLYFVLPVTAGCSFAFMLPVATPPNAIIYSTRLVSIAEMAIAGLGVDVICIGLTVLNIHTTGWLLFRLDTYPDWAKDIDATLSAANVSLSSL